MTTAESTVRKPTAKEIAEEALEIGNQLRTELTELRTQVREGVPVAVAQEGSGDAALAAQVAKLDKDVEGLVDDLNELAKRISEPVTDDAAVRALERKTADSFAKFSQIIDGYNTAATSAIEELREQMPSVADLVNRVAELAEKVQMFDEAGIAPASGEDLDSLDARLKAIEAIAAGTKLPRNVTILTADGVTAATTDDVNNVHQRINELREDLQRTREHVGTLTVPALRSAAIERTADQTAINLHGTQVPAIYGQVWQLMNLITELGKDKTADKKMGGYAFRSIDSAMTAVGHAQRQIGVMFQPREILDQKVERYETVSKDGYRQNWTHVWTRQRYAFVSLVDGSEMDAIEMDGEARDNGDKSTSKADSMRLKYALLQSLMIPITGLPESDGSDGTEGGQTYGRGDAGESWENATPAPPRGAHEQHVDSRPPSTPEEVENSTGTAYGYGHQPAGSPGGQAHAQAAQRPAEDDRTPEEKATAAYHALVALAGIEPAGQRTRLDKILRGIVAAKIGNVIIQTADGRQVTLDQYAATVNSQVGA